MRQERDPLERIRKLLVKYGESGGEGRGAEDRAGGGEGVEYTTHNIHIILPPYHISHHIKPPWVPSATLGGLVCPTTTSSID